MSALCSNNFRQTFNEVSFGGMTAIYSFLALEHAEAVKRGRVDDFEAAITRITDECAYPEAVRNDIFNWSLHNNLKPGLLYR